jgi:hypothetical protein
MAVGWRPTSIRPGDGSTPRVEPELLGSLPDDPHHHRTVTMT